MNPLSSYCALIRRYVRRFPADASEASTGCCEKLLIVGACRAQKQIAVPQLGRAFKMAAADARNRPTFREDVFLRPPPIAVHANRFYSCPFSDPSATIWADDLIGADSCIGLLATTLGPRVATLRDEITS